MIGRLVDNEDNCSLQPCCALCVHAFICILYIFYTSVYCFEKCYVNGFLNINYTCSVLYDVCVCISDCVCSAVLSPEEDSTQGSKGENLNSSSL